MKIIRIIIVSITCLIFSGSCNVREKGIEMALEEMKRYPISFMPSDYININGIQNSSIIEENPEYTLMVYNDSSRCTPCALKHIAYWNTLQDSLSNIYKGRVNIQLVYSNSDIDIEEVKEIIGDEVRVPIYLDTANLFLKNNRHVPSTPLMHTFLLNEQGYIQIVGNPSLNRRIEHLLFSFLRDN